MHVNMCEVKVYSVTSSNVERGLTNSSRARCTSEVNKSSSSS